MGRPPKQVKKEKDKKDCLECKRNLVVENNFYSSSSKFHTDGRLPICKDCIEEMINVNDVSTLHNVLRQIDKPYIHDIWEGCKGRDGNPIRNYFRQINSLHQYKHKVFDDSVFGTPKTISFNGGKPIVDSPEVDFELSDETIIKWGSGYTPEEYMRLENFYQEMKRSYEIETASHVDYLKKICKVSLKMDLALDGDDIDSYKKLSDSYDKLMHSAKFTAVQRSASDRTGGMNSFGEFYEFIEKQGFIPKFHTDEPQDVVDETIANLKKFNKNLILGDASISAIVEQSIKKMAEKGMDDDVYEGLDDEALDADELDAVDGVGEDSYGD